MNIIHENSAYVKKYKCPYCESRLARKDMSDHIEKKHEDFIPQGQTPLQVAFNSVNKKTEPYGTCIMCGNKTKWNENKGRYERLCGSKKCHNDYVKMTEERLKKARGVTKQEMLSNPEFQEKMLSNRSISGTYKFTDGGTVKYVGSYEKNLLEFMDKVLNVKSEDIQAPGPTISYYYKGKEHFWITDFMYIPYNLVFDVKDGGSNPNNREMTEYREKQVAKEKAITKLNQYNYCRLTDNNFSQLLHIMLEIKESLVDAELPNIAKEKAIIRINEANTVKRSLESEINSILEVAQYSKTNKYPVFITLMHTGTTMSNVIRSVTRDEFSHSCISFSSKLTPLYSFGSKKLNSPDLGLTKIGPDDEFFRHFKAHYAVYVMYLNKDQYNKMKNRLKYFLDNEDNMKYDFASLIACALQIPTEFRKKYFCSRFVMDIIGAGTELDKVPSLWTPQHIATLDNISMVNGGDDFNKYDYRVTEKNMKYIEKGTPEKITVTESAIHGENEILDDSLIIEKTYSRISNNGIANSYAKIKGYDKPMRGRSEMLVIKGDSVLLAFNPDGTYKIPGGGWDDNESYKDAAIRETQEEVRISVKNVRHCGQYIKNYGPVKEWVKKYVSKKDWWYGDYTELFIGEYDGKYTGHIDEEDKDPMINKCKFYKISEIINKLKPEHRQALIESNMVHESSDVYGLPALKKYPMPDEKHVRSAIKFFNYVDEDNERELAVNIKKQMKKYNISPDCVGDKNRLKKYIAEGYSDCGYTTMIFDMGSVLVECYWEKYLEKTKIPKQYISEIIKVFEDTKDDRIETCSIEECIEIYSNAMRDELKPYAKTAFYAINSSAEVFDYTVELLETLKDSGYKLYYLSNWSRAGHDLCVKSGAFDILKYFDGGIFSYEVGLMKPDKRIYELLLSRYDINPQNAVFYDDRKENMDAAKDIDIRGGVVFTPNIGYKLLENNKGYGSINESTVMELVGPAPGGMPPANQKQVYVVNNMKKNAFVGIGYGDDISITKFIPSNEEDDLTHEQINEMIQTGEAYVYKYTGPEAYMEMCISESVSNSTYSRSDYQRVYPEICTEVDAVGEVTEATMRSGIARIKGDPLLQLAESFNVAPDKFSEYNIKCHRDVNGLYIQNTISGVRSKSRESLDSVPSEVIKLVHRGFI